ncbi:GAF and ANTAR domain-containing protein [Janibacter cremeus]|uniref:GAF and ANTAR domain-containing protein n=1 Tax=Janibacter cremeus TaxID=1285192 RepID=UPI0023F61BB8|nr:GAF and ANTAR domain-containing protein [Janibacter cremeus]WEV78429.1 GAF and ANTAR domain-containing protein [Janibacter cremeus]
MTYDTLLSEALVEASREINAPQDLEGTLDGIVAAAARSLPNIDHVGISIVHRRGDIETKAGTDQLVWELDALQYSLGEGPCVQAVESQPITIANRLRHETRWPKFVPRAVAMGVQAQMGVRLYVERETLGVLNLYATESDTIDADVAHTAELFAAHAAIALGRARREEQLSEAIATRKAIGQAIGLVMERYRIDEDRAFQFLVRVSTTSNIKVRDLAEELIDTANENYRPGS